MDVVGVYQCGDGFEQDGVDLFGFDVDGHGLDEPQSDLLDWLALFVLLVGVQGWFTAG
jgi:hypothetical protein